jgi:hypothetical protein
VDHPESLTLQPPVTVSSRLDRPRAVDQYSFTATKGKPLALRAESQGLGLAVAPLLRITDGGGHDLAHAVPASLHDDTALAFTPPADGTYKLSVRDLYGHGGPRSVYRLRVAPPEPDFALTVAADRFAIPAGQTLDLPVSIQRLNGFAGPIDVAAEGLPPGVQVETLPGTDPAKATLRLKARPDATSAGPIRVVGRANGGSNATRHAAAALPTPFDGAPTLQTDWLWVTVVRPPPPKPPSP